MYICVGLVLKSPPENKPQNVTGNGKKTNPKMNYRIKIIDLKKCNSTDEVYDCFAETLNFNQGKIKVPKN